MGDPKLFVSAVGGGSDINILKFAEYAQLAHGGLNPAIAHPSLPGASAHNVPGFGPSDGEVTARNSLALAQMFDNKGDDLKELYYGSTHVGLSPLEYHLTVPYDDKSADATLLDKHYKSDDYDKTKGTITLTAFQQLEEQRERIVQSLALLGSMRLVTESNRNLMINFLADNVQDGYLARANYEIALSNWLDLRETHRRTQAKLHDMTRLGEVQTYYKMYYGAKKQIIFETVLVLLLVVVLYTLKRNGLMPDELFRLFLVITLFVYIFFRLSWQIVDFVSRDKRYFDKYDFGELDGSYNIHKFADLETEVVKSHDTVKSCLDKFIKNLRTSGSDWSSFVATMCAYVYITDKVLEDHGVGDGTVQTDGQKLAGLPIEFHHQMLYVMIYETLVAKYGSGCTPSMFIGLERNFIFKDVDEAIKDKCAKLVEESVDEDKDKDKNPLRKSEVKKHCEVNVKRIDMMAHQDNKNDESKNKALRLREARAEQRAGDPNNIHIVAAITKINDITISPSIEWTTSDSKVSTEYDKIIVALKNIGIEPSTDSEKQASNLREALRFYDLSGGYRAQQWFEKLRINVDKILGLPILYNGISLAMAETDSTVSTFVQNMKGHITIIESSNKIATMVNKCYKEVDEIESPSPDEPESCEIRLRELEQTAKQGGSKD